MSITYVRGNLLDWTHWNVIGHCCSCQNRMGSGVAKAIKERYPAAFDADTVAHEEGRARLGLLSYAEVEPGRRVVNIYGQQHYGYAGERYLDYEGIYVGLERLRDLLDNAHKEGRVYSLGLPYLIGCHRAGGSWPVLDAMIHHLWAASPVQCFVVELPQGSAPASVPATESPPRT